MRHCPSHEWDAYAANYGEDDRTAFERFMANRLRTAINLPHFEFRFTLLGILQARGEWKRTGSHFRVTIYPGGDALEELGTIGLQLSHDISETLIGWQQTLDIQYRPAPIDDAGWTTSEGWPEQHLRRIQKIWRWQ